MTATTPPTKPLPACDCLNDCGDDPRLDRGTARPCQVYINHIKTKRLQAAAADLLASCVELLNYIDTKHTDQAEVARAREAIRKALKGTP